MTSLTIRRMPYVEFKELPNNEALLAEYARECAIAELGAHDPQHATYEVLEALGKMHLLAVCKGGDVIGFSIVVMSENPHFGEVIATTESLFIASEHRSSGAGLALIREVERLAADEGAIGIFIGAPIGSRLDSVLRGKDYRPTTVAHFKALR